MTLYDLLSYINLNGLTTVIARTKGDDGIELGSNRPHEEFPEFTWNKDIDHINVNLIYGELVITLDVTNDDVESEVIDYLVKECGYSMEEATVNWDKEKLGSNEKYTTKQDEIKKDYVTLTKFLNRLSLKYDNYYEKSDQKDKGSEEFAYCIDAITDYFNKEVGTFFHISFIFKDFKR